jgi:peptide chain release factor 2
VPRADDANRVVRVVHAQQRLGELEALMAGDTFWNSREQAQKTIEEATGIRNRIEPLFKAEKRLEDLREMIELCEAEPESEQPKHLAELEKDLAKFLKELDSIELRVFLSGSNAE